MSNLIRYGQSALDKTFPDSDESVFGHMVLELGMSPDEAVQNLRPWVRDLDRSAELSKKTAYISAFIGAGAGLATAATMGIGLTAILPIAAAAYNFFAGQQSAREQGVRESEYLLLKTCPELLKLIYALTQEGMPKEALVECYDDLLGAFTVQFQQRASLGMSDELDHDIIRSFQRTVEEKCNSESLARAIVAETEGFVFDTLYRSTEPKTESLPAAPVVTSSPIGNNTRLGAVEVQTSPAGNSQAEATQPMDNVSVLNRAFQQSDAIGLPNELIQTMVETPYSNFVIGMSGAGKDILVHSLMKAIRAKYPQATIIGIDGKGAMKERPMWDAAIYNETVHFSMADHPRDYHPRLKHIFDRADSLPPHSFVVFSEVNGTRDSYIGNGMGRQWQEISSKIRYLALQGNEAGRFIYATAQTATKEELGIGAGRGNVQFCLISNGQQQSFVNAVVKAAVFDGSAVKNVDSWQSAISRSTAISHLKNSAQLGGVAYFHSAIGRWLPMPRLENPGRDRGDFFPAEPAQTEAPNAARHEVPDNGAPVQESSESEQSDPKANIKRPNLSRTELVLSIAELGEWIDENPGLSFDQMYGNYSARRKGFSRPEFRFLLTQIGNLDA